MKIIGDYEYEWFANGLNGKVIRDCYTLVLDIIEEKHMNGWEPIAIIPTEKFLFRRKRKSVDR